MQLEQQFCKDIFRMKYMINGESSPEEVFRGISKEIASAEKPRHRRHWEDVFYDAIASRKFIPGGRILANARPGSKLRNYGNCYVIPISDSLPAIYDALKEDAIISGAGGGVGFNISPLRPKNAPIKKGGESSGPMSFGEVFDSSAKVIRNGGGRRCLPLWYQVEMADGSAKKLIDVVVGDAVLFDGKNYKVNAVYLNGKQPLVKIITKQGWHVSTPNHRWLVKDLKTGEIVWKKAAELVNPANAPRYAFAVPKH